MAGDVRNNNSNNNDYRHHLELMKSEEESGGEDVDVDAESNASYNSRELQFVFERTCQNLHRFCIFR